MMEQITIELTKLSDDKYRIKAVGKRVRKHEVDGTYDSTLSYLRTVIHSCGVFSHAQLSSVNF